MKLRSQIRRGTSRTIRITGFTLIELIVVVIIMMALLGFSLVNYSSYNDSQRLKQAALTLKSDLQLTRTNASSGKKPLECYYSGDAFLGYTVDFLLSSYTVTPLCENQTLQPESTVTLPDGIVFSDPVPPFTVTYLPLTQGISEDSPHVVTLKYGTSTLRVVVDETSSIPIITSTNTPTNTPIIISTNTPTNTSTPTSTLTPTPTVQSCQDQCSTNFYVGVCETLAECNDELDGTSKGAGYGCTVGTICCCFMRK